MSLVAEEHDEVNATFTLETPNNVLNSIDAKFCVGFGIESGVPLMFDSSALGMLVGESRLLKVDPATWGPDEKLFSCIPDDENSDLILKTTVNQIRKINHIWHLNEDQKLDNAQCLKNRGNRLFEVKEYTRALRAYKLGVRTLEGSVSVSPATNYSTCTADLLPKKLLATLLTNSALCLLKIFHQQKLSPHNRNPVFKKNANGEERSVCGMDLLRPCIVACEKALNLEPDNVKASFRMGEALSAMEDFDKAISAGERALSAIDNTLLNETSLRVQIETALERWRILSRKQNRAKHMLVRQAFLRRAAAIRNGRLTSQDSDDDEVDRVEISQWSNDLAANMMSLHEELEAFGEKMPEVSRVSRSGRGGQSKHRLTCIEDIQSDDE